MKLTIEVASQSELEKIILFFQSIQLEGVRIISDTLTRKNNKKKKNTPKITRGDKTLDPTDLFGIWADNPRSIEDIREKGWKRS